MLRAIALLAFAGTAVASAKSTDPGAGRVAGKPANCVRLDQTNRVVIADANTLTLRDGRRLWITHPIGQCTRLNPNDTLVLEVWGSQLCRNDRFRTLQPGTTIPSAFCRFGEFVPYVKK